VNKIQFTSVIATIVLGVALFSTMTGLNEIEMLSPVDYFNSDFTGLAFASPHDNHKQNKHHDPRIYVNTLSYNNTDFTLLDSCDNLTDSLPCLKIDPFTSGSDFEIFIADPALQSTRTAILVTILEQNEFHQNQPDDVYSSPYVVDAFSGVTSITVSTFNDVRGVFVTFDRVSFEDVGEKIFDITYTFIETPVDKEDDTCDCDKPSNLLVEYDGPNPETATAEIYKKEGEVGDSNKLLGTFSVVNGEIYLQADMLTSGKDTLEANTVFRIMDGAEQIAVLSVHTSCSKPLFIGQQFTANAGEDNMVSLTVLDGTDTTGNTSIPAASCSDE
jgi:hypothetical protein